MVWDVNRGGQALSRDEQLVLDHVSGLTSTLAAPQGPVCQDREIVGELMATRAKVGSLAITPPRMRLRFEDVLAAAREASPAFALTPGKDESADGSAGSVKEGRIIYWLTSRWGIGLVTAASVAVAFMTGACLTDDGFQFGGQAQVEQSPYHYPDLALAPTPSNRFADNESPISPYKPDATSQTDSAIPNLVRSGHIHLRHSDPSSIQQRVTDLVTSQGGAVTNLTRYGMGLDTNISLEVAVPAENWRAFLNTIASLGEVVGQTEAADEVTGQKIDLKARLAEAIDYLKRLDALAEKQATLTETQTLERERRETRRQIETFKATLEALENRISLSRLTVRVSAQAPATAAAAKGEFAKAWDDGVSGLEKLTATGMKAGIAGSPLLLGGALVYLALRHRRRREHAASK